MERNRHEGSQCEDFFCAVESFMDVYHKKVTNNHSIKWLFTSLIDPLSLSGCIFADFFFGNSFDIFLLLCWTL